VGGCQKWEGRGGKWKGGEVEGGGSGRGGGVEGGGGGGEDIGSGGDSLPATASAKSPMATYGLVTSSVMMAAGDSV
jgi:hypothetical protein